uniref:Papilin-like n=1 Tax=Petromyzon marinus TaxID=7757 RepID=A0AAJ7XCP4_PETMA|nr:papilin-like [Petromyzon marinus]
MPHNVAWCWCVFLWALCCCVKPIGGQDARVAECRLPREQPRRGTDDARSSLRFAYDASRDSCKLVWVTAAVATSTTTTSPTASPPPRDDDASLFTSDRACMRSCSRRGPVLYPTGAEVCLLPKDTGSCRAHFRLWFFNVERRRCENFTYGGCRGNGNRFVEQKTCANVCQHLIHPEIQDRAVGDHNDHFREGAVAAAVFGALFGITITVVLVVFAIKRKRNIKTKAYSSPHDYGLKEDSF